MEGCFLCYKDENQNGMKLKIYAYEWNADSIDCSL